MRKDFSTFKVLGITLLVTMSSCVVGVRELNAETFRNYGLEFDITSSDRTQVVIKQKKSKISSPSKFIFGHLIEYGRTNITIAGLSPNYASAVFHLWHDPYPLKQINTIVTTGNTAYSTCYHGIIFQKRAGPNSFLL